MEEFKWRPLYSAQGMTTFRTLVAQFGDGYTQRAADGMNANEETWELEFLLSKSELYNVTQFLNKHGGHAPFLWVTHPYGDRKHYVASEPYLVTRVGANRWKLTAKFTQTRIP